MITDHSLYKSFNLLFKALLDDELINKPGAEKMIESTMFVVALNLSRKAGDTVK